MTLKEVAKYLRVCNLTARRWLTSGALKGTKINKRGDWRVAKKDVENYLKKFN